MVIIRKERELASQIIDIIEDQIRKAHPSLDKKAKRWKGNNLLYGEDYYLTEDWITDILIQHSHERKEQFNPSKRRSV